MEALGAHVTGNAWAYTIGTIAFLLLLASPVLSILVPLKAAALNLLSIGAAYGVLVMVFQWGWGKGLIGLESTAPIVSFIPMFRFAIVFGLSMDHEEFLLSRVREEHLLTGDNDASVIHGFATRAKRGFPHPTWSRMQQPTCGSVHRAGRMRGTGSRRVVRLGSPLCLVP